jgi:hypothetical protein
MIIYEIIGRLNDNLSKELDRIYRMDRIFFAFPEERQKASSLLGADFKFPRQWISFRSFFRKE